MAQLVAECGGVDGMKEGERDSRGMHRLDDLVQDLRLSLRTLLRNRGLTAVALLTLAVGIGGNTAIFSVVKGVLWTPLPYPDADRIVRVSAAASPRTGLAELPFSEAGYWHFVNNNRSFEAFGGYAASARQWRVPLLGDGPPQEVIRMSVQVRALEVLGVMPQLGRLPTREEERRVPLAPVALISHGLWVDRYGSDPSIIGRNITLSTSPTATPSEVIGVMPKGFDFPTPDVDVWTLRRVDPESEDVAEHSLLAIGRLAPGVTIEEAVAEAESLIAGFDELGYAPQRLAGLFSGKAIVRPLMDDVVGDAREPLLIAFGTAVFVLLIACSNVANLLLVRAESRTREHAVRMALGSGRGRLIQYIMMESVLLTLAGGVAGIGLAYVGTRVLVAAGPVSIPRLNEIRIDATVLFFTTVISIGAGLLFGFLPAVRASSGRALGALRAGSLGSNMGMARNRVLGGLVVAQMALALVLLVGSGLMVRSFQQLRAVDPGFDPEGVVTFRVSPSNSRYRGAAGAEYGLYYYPLLERLAAVPGVTSVGGVSSLPLTGVVGEPGSTLGPVQVDEFPAPAGELRPNFLTKRTSPGYFETMGIPILEGREFIREDYSPDYSRTAFVISASVKRRYWPNESALGKRLTWGRMTGSVVGVTGDVHHEGLGKPAEEIIYSAQIGRALMIAVRTSGDPDLVVPRIRAAVAEIDPEVPVTHLQTMDRILGDSLSRTSFTMTLLVLAAGVALFLGAVGIYGVVSYVASQQSTEMGVRLALGADPERIRNLILSRGMSLTGLGVALGLSASVALGSVLNSLLFGVQPLDLQTLIVASVLLLGVAAVSSIIPASRAAKTSPAAALRAEG